MFMVSPSRMQLPSLLPSRMTAEERWHHQLWLGWRLYVAMADAAAFDDNLEAALARQSCQHQLRSAGGS
jgi:hypothetical protein